MVFDICAAFHVQACAKTADTDVSDNVGVLCLALQDVLPGCAKTADTDLSGDVGVLCLALQDILPGCAKVYTMHGGHSRCLSVFRSLLTGSDSSTRAMGRASGRASGSGSGPSTGSSSSSSMTTASPAAPYPQVALTSEAGVLLHNARQPSE